MSQRTPPPHADETRLRAEVQRLRRELEALHQTTSTLAVDDAIDDVVAAIVSRAAALVEGAEGVLCLVDDDGQLRLRFATGAAGALGPVATEYGEGAIGRVWRDGEPLAINDYRSWPGRRQETGGLDVGAIAALPLHGADGVIGVLALWHPTERAFPEDVLDLLDRFSGLAAVALERLRLTTELRAEFDERRRTEDELLDTVARLTSSEHALRRSHEETVRRLAAAAEFRDAETGRHVERVGPICERIARTLGLDEAYCELMRLASPLHDIGKIGVPEQVLLKPDVLTEEERRLIERHVEIGYRILSGSKSELLDLAASIALTHHERFDGSGYPAGTAGPEIPIEGRIAAVADVFDALTSDRVYRPAYPDDIALELMLDGRGSQFDPEVLDAFLDTQWSEPVTSWGERPTEPPRLDSSRKSDHGSIELDLLRGAAASAVAALRTGVDARGRIDAALKQFCATSDGHLIASVYILDHDHLWCIAQVGYDQVRDGFAVGQGVLGRCVGEGATVFLADVHADAGFIAAVPNIVSELAVPLVGRHARAVLNIETIGRRLPDGCEEAIAGLVGALSAIADDVASAARIDLTTMAHLCVHASSLRGVSALAEFATRTLGRLYDLEATQLDLGTHPSGPPASFWRRPDSSLQPVAAPRIAAALANGLSATAVTVADAADIGLAREDERFRRVVWMPLRSGDALVGTLIGRSDGAIELDQEQSDGAALLAQHMAALIEVAQALRRERRAAITDSLTGLLNRRGFDQRLEEELGRAGRSRSSLALVLLDCDDLKQINDSLGHDRGDATLQALGRVIREHRRVGDLAARIGGDEFALGLPGADRDAASAVAERLRVSLRIGHQGGAGPTASFGIAVYPDDAITGPALRRAADRALYQAKLRGKDRVSSSL